MSDTNFVVLLRATQNWADPKLDQFSLANNPLTRHHTYADAIAQWNALYKLTLQEFRSRLVEIARSTWPTTEVITWVEGWTPDPNTVYLATDDDDWFRPDVLKQLQDNYVTLPLFVWRSQTMLFIDKIARRFFPNMQYVNSNAYALHGRNLVFEQQLFNHHKLPSEVHLMTPLSMYLAHPASLYHRCISPSELPFIVPEQIRFESDTLWSRLAVVAVHELLIETDSSLYKD